MRRTVLAVIAACLLTGGGWVAGEQAEPYRVPIDPRAPTSPNILSGPDIGFRVEGKTPGGVVGTWMVRLKTGEWVKAHSSPGRGRVVPLDTK
jgi:hypothetical protein